MKLNLKYVMIYGSVLLVFIASFIYLHFIGEKSVTTLHCNGVQYTHNKNYSIKSNIDITFYNNEGFMVLNGKVTENGVSSHLARQLLFNISDINNSIILTFTGIEVGIADEVDRNKSHIPLPAFMSTVGSTLLISIYRKNKHNYIVESNGIASFLCVSDD